MTAYDDAYDPDPDDSLFIHEMSLYQYASAYKCLRRTYAGKEVQMIEVVTAVADQFFKNNKTRPSMSKVVNLLAKRT